MATKADVVRLRCFATAWRRQDCSWRHESLQIRIYILFAESSLPWILQI